MRISRRSYGRAALALSVLVGMGSACTWDTVVARAGLPGTRVAAEISDLSVRGSYLDARVSAGGFRYRLFFPNLPECGELLREADGLVYTWRGIAGRISNEQSSCDAVGVLSLREWRDRQPRRSREPLPRSSARFEVIFSDDDLIQLRGRFPLASQLGFSGTGQLIAVLPKEEACERFLSSRTASMEFRASGPVPLTLLSGRQRCPVLGLAQPLPPS
jgi:hypothetical protein